MGTVRQTFFGLCCFFCLVLIHCVACPASIAYFVVEHQPQSCDQYPADGEFVFSDIQIARNGAPVAAPAWQAIQNGQYDACNTTAHVEDKSTIKFTWDTS